MGSKVLKFVIAGDGAVGKTTLTKVFCNNKYIDQIMTLGVDLHSKEAVINDTRHTLQIWDLSGQVQFRFMLEDFVRLANGVIIAFDASRESSFQNLPTWVDLIRSVEPDAPTILIATKIDLGYHPNLNRDLAMSFMRSHNLIGFVETSAKQHSNVDVPFRRLLEYHNKLKPDTVSIVFEGEEQRQFFRTEPPSPAPPPTPEQNLQQTPQVPVQLNVCPYCATPLRSSQIKLKQTGKRVLCQNCLELI